MTGVLFAGTSSGAGKSLVVTGVCRALRRRGIDVAPFKSLNMSNNSMVCPDGSEIGRAQYLQAQAAGVEPTSAMNPVLLKPGGDHTGHVVLRGRPHSTLRAGECSTTDRQHLAAEAFAAYGELEAQHEIVLCEGAGSPAEINLRAGDYVNMGLARRFNLPVIVVGDIDRGGVLASLYGTWSLLDSDDRALLMGYLINKFRGDASILQRGLQELDERMQSRCFGVLRFPCISNATDIDALAHEPDVDVVMSDDDDVLLAADLVILPGSRATVTDLGWLRNRGLDQALHQRAAHGLPILGICGGYQMLAEHIVDGVETQRIESEADEFPGLGLLPLRVNRRGQDDPTVPTQLARNVGGWLRDPSRPSPAQQGIEHRFRSGGTVSGWAAAWGGVGHNDPRQHGERGLPARLAVRGRSTERQWMAAQSHPRLRSPPGIDDRDARRRDGGTPGSGSDAWPPAEPMTEPHPENDSTGKDLR